MTDFKKIARKLIVDFKLTPPIDIEVLAKAAGVEIIEQSLEDSTSGALITAKNGKSYIVINENHSPTRKRFSIAHEFAHFLLHKNSADVFIDNFTAIFRDGNSSKGKDRKEIQANNLAAEILIPEEFIIKEVGNKFVNFHDEETISTLARKFNVSNQAMAIRLEKLNLIHVNSLF